MSAQDDPFAEHFGSPQLASGRDGAPPHVRGPRPPRARRRALAAAAVAAVASAVAASLAIGGSAPPRTPAAIARAINLRQADVPGYAPESNQNPTVGGQPQARLNRCLGLGLQLVAYTTHGSAIANAGSPLFVSGSGFSAQEVESSVAIEGSPVTVARDLAEGRRELADGRLRRCLASALDHVTYTYSDGTRIALGGVTVGAVSPPASSNAFGMRIGMSLSRGAVTVPLYMDLYGFGVGRDELSLLTFGVAGPVPAATEAQLASVIIARAKALPH